MAHTGRVRLAKETDVVCWFLVRIVGRFVGRAESSGYEAVLQRWNTLRLFQLNPPRLSGTIPSAAGQRTPGKTFRLRRRQAQAGRAISRKFFDIAVIPRGTRRSSVQCRLRQQEVTNFLDPSLLRPSPLRRAVELYENSSANIGFGSAPNCICAGARHRLDGYPVWPMTKRRIAADSSASLAAIGLRDALRLTASLGGWQIKQESFPYAAVANTQSDGCSENSKELSSVASARGWRIFAERIHQTKPPYMYRTTTRKVCPVHRQFSPIGK